MSEMTTREKLEAGVFVNNVSFLQSKQEWRDEQFRLNAELRKSLEDEHDMKNHPKADAVWNKAWDLGHAFGYSEVINEYEDLVKLIK